MDHYYWTTGNYFGREASAFLNWCNRHQWMGHDWTTALGTTTAAKRLPSWIRATGINKLVTIGGQLTPLESGQLASIYYGSFYFGEIRPRTKRPPSWIGATGINNWWVTIGQLGSGRFAFGQLQKLGNVTTSFRSKNLFNSNSLYTVPPQHKTSQFYTNPSVASLVSHSKVVGVGKPSFLKK